MRASVPYSFVTRGVCVTFAVASRTHLVCVLSELPICTRTRVSYIGRVTHSLIHSCPCSGIGKDLAARVSVLGQFIVLGLIYISSFN